VDLNGNDVAHADIEVSFRPKFIMCEGRVFQYSYNVNSVPQFTEVDVFKMLDVISGAEATGEPEPPQSTLDEGRDTAA